MEAEARYTWVGLAVLGLLAALLGSALWLKNVGHASDFRLYTIHFERQALDGLQVGADVSLRGVKVGRVEDYALDETTFNRVNVTVRLDRRAPVHEKTTAVVSRNFVTGLASITLVTPSPPGGLLLQAQPGETYPAIAEGRSDLEDITGRVTRIGDIAAETLQRLNGLLNDENTKAVAETLRNLQSASRSLNERLATLDKSVSQVGNAATQVGQASASLARSGERMAAVAEQGGRQLEPLLVDARRAVAETRQAMVTASAAIDRLQQQTGRTAARLEATAAGVDDQLSAALSDLRLALDSTARLMDNLREPRSALLGPPPGLLGPGERLP